MTKQGTERVMSKADAVSMILFMLAGAAIAVVTVVAAVMRIVEVLPGRDVRVFAEFAGTVAQAPIGPDGEAAPVELDTGWVIAPELPAASVGAIVIQQIILAGAVITVVTCLLLVTNSILRGRMFSRTNTRLVTVAGFVAIVGYAAMPFFGNMGANGAFVRISDGTFDNVIMAVDLYPLILLAFLAALGSLTFTVGERIRRDTEGLV
ncbi:hypothetical protein GCM10022200_19850 [Microbacterium awajiense]|uniref:DUF2975 domain-containing protein n=1 Tax=Microbacterium awajiense TaxID=415214 RepID=A0ABP7AN32_9MICO